MHAVTTLAPVVGIKAACNALNVSRTLFYERRRRPAHPAPRKPPPRALSPAERANAVDVMNSPAYVDQAPAAIHADLLAKGEYLCSVRTMYRILQARGETGDRRNQTRHPAYKKPELLAEGPNRVWSWDITKLKGAQTWTYHYLYVIMDIYSRRIVGWCVAERECSAIAQDLISEAVTKHNVPPGQLTLHADRGSPMTAKATAQLLADLGVLKTHSRPHVSNDNPFSESAFKTLKYRPGFPKRFGSIQDARAFCRSFFAWYNAEHRHSGIGMLTPDQMHFGDTTRIQAQRQDVLDRAYALHPERFVKRRPTPPAIPTAVWINPPPKPSETNDVA